MDREEEVVVVDNHDKRAEVVNHEDSEGELTSFVCLAMENE